MIDTPLTVKIKCFPREITAEQKISIAPMEFVIAMWIQQQMSIFSQMENSRFGFLDVR